MRDILCIYMYIVYLLGEVLRVKQLTATCIPSSIWCVFYNTGSGKCQRKAYIKVIYGFKGINKQFLSLLISSLLFNFIKVSYFIFIAVQFSPYFSISSPNLNYQLRCTPQRRRKRKFVTKQRQNIRQTSDKFLHDAVRALRMRVQMNIFVCSAK